MRRTECGPMRSTIRASTMSTHFWMEKVRELRDTDEAEIACWGSFFSCMVTFSCRVRGKLSNEDSTRPAGLRQLTVGQALNGPGTSPLVTA